MIPILVVDQYMNPMSQYHVLVGLVPVNTWLAPGGSGPVLVVQVDINALSAVPPLAVQNALRAL